ncbi:hypothetical protein [Prochlorothrix hollandica]|uniref:hypothetical protein n=1 Tax=Prochlorothrix hollandica TaxID=1223 RepID=UPI0011D2A1B5|nr:hypothetical protein [Prochlorothrix hollandica]
MVWCAPSGGTPHDPFRTAVVIDERNNEERLNPQNLDDKIKIYERETRGWFFAHVEGLLNQGGQQAFDNGFVILMICASYFEAVEQYRTGQSSFGKTGKFFKNSIKRVIKDGNFDNSELNNLHSKFRCGLFHNGMTKKGVIFNFDSEKAIKFQDSMIIINPQRLFILIEEDFDQYLYELRDTRSTTVRENFNRIFSIT